MRVPNAKVALKQGANASLSIWACGISSMSMPSRHLENSYVQFALGVKELLKSSHSTAIKVSPSPRLRAHALMAQLASSSKCHHPAFRQLECIQRGFRMAIASSHLPDLVLPGFMYSRAMSYVVRSANRDCNLIEKWNVAFLRMSTKRAAWSKLSFPGKPYS